VSLSRSISFSALFTLAPGPAARFTASPDRAYAQSPSQRPWPSGTLRWFQVSRTTPSFRREPSPGVFAGRAGFGAARARAVGSGIATSRPGAASVESGRPDPSRRRRPSPDRPSPPETSLIPGPASAAFRVRRRRSEPIEGSAGLARSASSSDRLALGPERRSREVSVPKARQPADPIQTGSRIGKPTVRHGGVRPAGVRNISFRSTRLPEQVPKETARLGPVRHNHRRLRPRWSDPVHVRRRCRGIGSCRETIRSLLNAG